MWLTFTKHAKDEDIIAGICQDYPQRQVWENKLYIKFCYLIKDAVWKHKLRKDDASMAYSDALLITIQHIQAGSFEQRCSLKTYIFRIYQNKCIDRLRAGQSAKRQTNQAEELDPYLELLPDQQQDILRSLCTKYEVDRLKQRIQLMDDRCKQIILAWGEGYHDKEIAENLGYQSAAVAKTSRFRCLEKLKKFYQTAKNLTVIADGRTD
jgi:RNA polymerase sigma factor (sigma-70 family)